jgi:hypothetical protein
MSIYSLSQLYEIVIAPNKNAAYSAGLHGGQK